MQRRRLTCVIEMILPQPDEMISAIGINASNRSRVNVMTFLVYGIDSGETGP
jgi:hypothetical protein